MTAIRVLKFCRVRRFCERGERVKPPGGEERRGLGAAAHLSHVDELGEDLGPLLSRVPAEDHQLDPLGHPVTHHDRALQGGVVPHRALHDVAAVVLELANQIAAVRHRAARVFFSFSSRSNRTNHFLLSFIHLLFKMSHLFFLLTIKKRY